MSKTKCPKVNLKSRDMLPKYSDEELGLLAGRVGLTLEQLKTVGEMANRTYQAIGYDLAQANDGNQMKREEIVEVVLDCNYMEEHGRYGRTPLDPVIKEWLHGKWKYNLNHVYQAVAAVAFPYYLYE